MKNVLKILVLILFFSEFNYSWNYGGHKKNGYVTFLKVYHHLLSSRYFTDSTEAKIFLEKFLELKYDLDLKNYFLGKKFIYKTG